MGQKPYLNLGCGKIVLPGPQPAHHQHVDAAIYSYPLWVNADRNPAPGVDAAVDLFRYPWPWADNSFDGALLAHIVEHIPHGIASDDPRYLGLQDGWFAFFGELWRVLTPGAVAHIIAPYAFSHGAMTDPTHTRYITEHAFTHAMDAHADAPFHYENGGVHFEMAEAPRWNITEMFRHLVALPNDPPAVQAWKGEQLSLALATRVNVAYDMAVKLRAVK